MPSLADIVTPAGAKVLGSAQCWAAEVIQVTAAGAYVVVPSYDRNLRWGPCHPASAGVKVGDKVALAISEQGEPWLLGGGGGGGGDTSGAGNIDGGRTGAEYDGAPILDNGRPGDVFYLPNIDGGTV